MPLHSLLLPRRVILEPQQAYRALRPHLRLAPCNTYACIVLESGNWPVRGWAAAPADLAAALQQASLAPRGVALLVARRCRLLMPSVADLRRVQRLQAALPTLPLLDYLLVQPSGYVSLTALGLVDPPADPR